MARTNKTMYAILGILSVYPMSGYDIKTRLKKWIGGFWNESDGQIYPTLAKLQKAGLIKHQKTTATGKRQKQIYNPTTEGLKMLNDWLVKPAAEPIIRNEFMLKLFFGYQMSQQDYLAHISREKEKMQTHLQDMLTIEQHLRQYHLNPTKKTHNKQNKDYQYIPEAFYWLLILKGGIHQVQSAIKWCEEIEKIIRSRPSLKKKPSK